MLELEEFQAACFERTGAIEALNLKYRSIAEDNLLCGEDGRPIASVFTYTYCKETAADEVKRPVVFAFNGGPGSSSIMLHAGFLGAKRVDYDAKPFADPANPYPAVENRDSLLSCADLVVMDPVATGYGRLIDGQEAGRFYGIEQDAEAMLQVISGWLTRYRRWDSPKYLLAESYGTARAAVMAGLASGGTHSETYQLQFDGVILIGNTVSPSHYHKTDMKIEPSVLNFPTFAACRYFHTKGTSGLREFVKEAEEFSVWEYLPALYLGDSVSRAHRKAIREKITSYTGVGESYLEANELKINHVDFLSEGLRDQKKEMSIYDARFTAPCHDTRMGGFDTYTMRGSFDPFKDDPVLNRYEPYYRCLLEQVIAPDLGISFQRRFRGTYSAVQRIWDYETKNRTTAQQLSSAMRRNPRMRTFFINGAFDICTQTGLVKYTMRHGALPADRTFLKEYLSGHMIYVGEENCRQVSSDISLFLQGGTPADVFLITDD